MGFSWNSLLFLLLLSAGLLWAEQGLIVRCPMPGSSEPPYCTCSDTSASIRCDFQKKEAVVLTKELLRPYDNMSLSAAYVRVANATSLYVGNDFVEKWLEASSSAFDIWHSGTITFQPTPSARNTTTEKTSTFAGVGILNCHIPELPTSFLRDRTRGALRIKRSKVGVLRAGFLDNVKEMRYIVLQDSEVEKVEGSVATEGYVTLSQRSVHSWNGLILSNVSIGSLGRGAFNLTHMSDMEEMTVNDCWVGHTATGALSAAGDIQVTIKANIFHTLEKGAFKVNVTGDVYFNGNLMGAQGLDALGDLACHSTSSIQNNTILVSTPVRPVPGQSSTPFHASCGNPQLFMVLTPMKKLLVVEDTRAAWVLGATLAVVGMIMVVGAAWSFRRSRPILSVGSFPSLLKRRSHNTSLENLPRNIELNIPSEDAEEGTSVKDLDMTCEPHLDVEQHLLDTGSVAQSVQICGDVTDATTAASDDQHESVSIVSQDLS